VALLSSFVNVVIVVDKFALPVNLLLLHTFSVYLIVGLLRVGRLDSYAGDPLMFVEIGPWHFHRDAGVYCSSCAC
jgi:hypothetical protein